MTLAKLRDKADAKLATFWSALVTKQNAYHAKHGKYFQLLVSPENAVVDGIDSGFTIRHPSDELHQLDVDFSWTEKMPFQIRVDEYVGRTHGFRATVWVQLVNGDVYTRSRTYELQPDIVDRVYDENDEIVSETITPQPPLQIDSGWSKVEEE